MTENTVLNGFLQPNGEHWELVGGNVSRLMDRSIAKRLTVAALGIGCLLFAATKVNAAASEDLPKTHNMMVVGKDVVFLSHLPMFDEVSTNGNQFTSPHRFQVILQAKFAPGVKDLQAIYSKDRQTNLKTKMYTLNPEVFVLSRLFTPDPQHPRLTSINGTVFRGHFERGGRPISGLEGVTINIEKVIHSQEFDPRATKPKQLEYILFGKGPERFLAHAIIKPGDFDQILSINVAGHELTDEELSRGVRVVIPKRKNQASKRLKQNEQVVGTAQLGGVDRAGRPLATTFQIQEIEEIYFEDGELRSPPTFDQTPQEKAAGF
jgi:hypothetical protein